MKKCKCGELDCFKTGRAGHYVPSTGDRPTSDSLIATAPDLLAACRRAHDEIDKLIREQNPLDCARLTNPISIALRAAIAKAEGR